LGSKSFDKRVLMRMMATPGAANELSLSMVLASIPGASGAGAERHHRYPKDDLVSAFRVPA
jgi:hypothetical protein